MLRTTRRLRKQLVAATAVVAFGVPATSSATVAEQYFGFSAPTEAQRGQPSYAPAPEIAAAPGFDWGDAGIGAASVLGLVLILVSVMLAVVHRRSPAAEGRKGPVVTS
jgi:hypothetical protein